MGEVRRLTDVVMEVSILEHSGEGRKEDGISRGADGEYLAQKTLERILQSP